MTPDSQRGAAKPDRTPVSHSTAKPSPTILRFLAAERFLHWALAIPFVLLYLSALGMLAYFGEPYPRTFRHAFAWAHRAIGIALIVLPPAALIAGSADWRMHLENMREGWRWTRDDLRWLVLFPRNAMDPRVKLPEQGKFNAAEKLNFMMVSLTYPLYILTGLLVWLPGVAFFPYLAHFAMAIVGSPLVLGHIFMATINPDTKVGLSGMITGWVDRGWARHHYERWYRERFETAEDAAADRDALLKQPAQLRCEECQEVQAFDSWAGLIQRLFRMEPIFCPACEAEIPIANAAEDASVVDEILKHVENGGASQPFVRTDAGGA